MGQETHSKRLVTVNRKARHEYVIEDRLEAGLVLVGTEVKSLRNGSGDIADSYAAVREGTMQLLNAYIPEYFAANRFNHDPRRPRKLLLHRREIVRLSVAVGRKGVTLVPLSIYFNERGRAKVELGLARGKQLHDKRAMEKDRSWARDKARIMREGS